MKSVPDSEVVAAYQRNGSVWKAGKEIGLAGQTVHERLRALGYPLARRRWTVAETDELRALLANEMPVGKIAHRLGRTFAGVMCRMNELGLRAPRRRPRADDKIPRGAGYDKASIKRHLDAVEKSPLGVTRYCRANGLNIEVFVRAVERHFPDRWFEFVKTHTSMPETTCPYCGRIFYPNSGKQRFCTRQCGDDSRRDAEYFGGKRRETVGLAEGVCQLCARKVDKGLSSHHLIGKENDPENESLIALCRGCHKIVSLLASRAFVDDGSVWETLVALVWSRHHGHEIKEHLAERALYVSVEIEVVADEDEFSEAEVP